MVISDIENRDLQWSQAEGSSPILPFLISSDNGSRFNLQLHKCKSKGIDYWGKILSEALLKISNSIWMEDYFLQTN